MASHLAWKQSGTKITMNMFYTNLPRTFFHHTKIWKAQKLAPKCLWWTNNVSCQYKVHFRLWPMSKKSWAKLLKESMTNGTCGGAKNNGIFNCHRTFRCVDLACVIELVYTMDLVCQVMVEGAWMMNINKCKKVVICSKTLVCLELVCMWQICSMQ